MSELEETAKATQEVAKTTNTAIETTRDFGNYMSQFFTPPLEQVSELITDKLKYYTWSNKLNLMSKAKKKMDKLGLHAQNTIPLKLGIPLLEAASLEEDDKLQELWANLLVNSSTGFSLERSYISVLEQMSWLETNILMKIYKTISPHEQYDDILLTLNTEEIFDDLIKIGISEYDIKLAFSNLTRLQCILRVVTYGGGENFKRIHTTIFGRTLFESIKNPINK